MAVSVATGFFDGVHLGHRLVLARLVELARARGEESVVVTLWPHPRAVLQQGADSLRLLTSLQDKTAMIRSLGVDRVEVLPFSRDFGALSTEAYLRDVLQGQIGAGALVLGYDNRIGADLLSPAQTADIAARLGLEVQLCDSVPAPGGDFAVSSTAVRRSLSEGRIEEARAMLGWDYSLEGAVVTGNRIGRTLGFPTANMQLYEPRLLVPEGGVYFVQVEVEGKSYFGMTNIGVRPTVDDGGGLTIETHILDFDEDIYGLDIRIRFLHRIREEHRFESLPALVAQLERDRETARKLILAQS